MRVRSQTSSCPETYQANTLSKSAEKAKRTLTVGSSHFVNLSSLFGTDRALDLLMKDGENGAGRVAGLELGGEWVCKKILLCAFFVFFQGIIEN